MAVALADLLVLLGARLGDLVPVGEVALAELGAQLLDREILRLTPFSSTAGPSSSGLYCSCAVSVCSCSWLSGSWISTNSPCGRRLMMPVSRPCSTFSLSRRWRPRQIRLVTMNAMTGPTKKKIRTNQVIELIDRWKCVAQRSFPPPTRPTKYAVIQATPSPVRVGALRRAVQDVVLALVAGDPGLDERIHRDDAEHQAEGDQRDEHAQGERVAPQVDLPARHHTDQTLGEAP